MHKLQKISFSMGAKFVALSLFVVLTSSLFAKTTKFIGRPGVEGGDKFSVAENWDNGLPVAGDTVVVSSLVETVWNDYPAGTYFYTLNMIKNADVDFASTLRGNSVKVENHYLRKGCKSYVEVSSYGNDLHLGGNGSSEYHGKLTCGTGFCRLSIENNTSLYVYAPLVVNGTLTGNNLRAYQHGALYICSTGNYFNVSKIWYNNVYFNVANAVDPEFVIDWGDYIAENNRGKYDFKGYDQAANRIAGTLTRTTGCQITGTGTLTLNGTADAISPCLIEGSLSVVWNPSGPYTQTFTNRAHTTTGSLTVSNGTMRLAAGGSFKNVKTITVAPGATFDLATPTASTLSGLTTLTVDGTFRFAEGSANPFGSSSLVAKIGATGKLHVPSDVTITISKVRAKGVWLDATSYSGEDWIEGGGTVVVTTDPNASSWKAAVDGMWSDGTKWYSGSVPSAKPAYVTAEGADYDVTFDEATFSTPEVHVGNDAGHTARLLLRGDEPLVSADSTKFNVSDGGVFEVSSGKVTLSNLVANATLATVAGAGVWRVSGGTNTMYTAGVTGKTLTLSNGGTLQISSGRFSTVPPLSYAPGFTMENGNIEVSGTGEFKSWTSEGESNQMGSGNITATENGMLNFGRAVYSGPSASGVPLRITLRDNASLSASTALGFGGSVGETCISLNDNAKCNFGQIGYFGINASCLARMDIYDNASVSYDLYGLYIGSMLNKPSLSTCFPTGIVNVVSGELSGGAQFYDRDNTQNNTNYYQGVIVGGAYNRSKGNEIYTYPYRMHGEMNVFANGTFSQGMGYLAVGMDLADGFVRIAGGTATKDASINKQPTLSTDGNGEILVGVCGGNGLFEVTDGGTANLKGKLYAGGVDPSTLDVPRNWFSIHTDSTASTGTVRVVDGTFTLDNTMVFGARGTGILEVGSNGIVNASSLVMSNNVESVLSFKFGPDGIGCVNLVGGLEIAPGAKLKVDASEYTGTESRRFPLVLAGSVSGSFASVEYDNRKLRMTFREDGLYATVNPAGFVLVVR